MREIKPKIDVGYYVNGEPMFRRLELKRPAVVRKGNVVKQCFYYEGTKQCLGPMCLWPKVGVCPIFNRLKVKFRAK